MQRRWFAKQLQEQIEISKLLTVEKLHPIPSSRQFLAYFQAPLSVLYLAFALFILFIFVRHKMTGFVNCIILLSSLIVIVPMFLTAPLITVFFNFVDLHLPIPFPWCYFFIHLETSGRWIAHTTSLYLKLLLGINRVCSLYRPLQTRIWFTTKRSIAYCCFTCLACLSVGILFNSLYQKVAIKPHFDLLWGEIQNYQACSLDPSIISGDRAIMIYISHIGILCLDIIGLVSVIICNSLLVVKLKKNKCKKQRSKRVTITKCKRS